eukprot:5049553-Amphidinium_carterae.1
MNFVDISCHRSLVAWCGGDVSRGSASGLVAPRFLWCKVCFRGSADWFTSSTRVLLRPRLCVSICWAQCKSRDDWSVGAPSLVQEYLPPTRVQQLQHLQ